MFQNILGTSVYIGYRLAVKQDKARKHMIKGYKVLSGIPEPSMRLYLGIVVGVGGGGCRGGVVEGGGGWLEYF